MLLLSTSQLPASDEELPATGAVAELGTEFDARRIVSLHLLRSRPSIMGYSSGLFNNVATVLRVFQIEVEVIDLVRI